MESSRAQGGRSGNFARMFCAVSIAVVSIAIVHNALYNQNSRVFSTNGVSISADSTKLDRLFSVLDIGPDGSTAGRTRMTIEPHQASASQDPRPAVDELTLAAQRELKRFGLYAGPIDGVLGERTVIAVKLYQRRNGLKVTGRPSQDLIDHMNYVRHIEQAATITGSIPSEPDAETVRAVQRGLVRLGYDAGPPDGKLGSRTQDALRAFQTDQRMTASGHITKEVLKHLER